MKTKKNRRYRHSSHSCSSGIECKYGKQKIGKSKSVGFGECGSVGRWRSNVSILLCKYLL